MNRTLCSLRAVLAIALCAGLSGAALAQQPDANDVAKANNPLADVKAFNVHNYYIGKLTETDTYANQFWLRYAQPFSIGESKWLMRASLPVMTNPQLPGTEHETGLGDFNVFAAYLIDVGNPAISFGVGPLINAPTATDDALGSGKWSAGLANVLFVGTNPKFFYGYLLTWQASFAGAGRPRRREHRRVPAAAHRAARRRHLLALDGDHELRLREQRLQRAPRPGAGPGLQVRDDDLQPLRRAAVVGGQQGHRLAAVAGVRRVQHGVQVSRHRSGPAICGRNEENRR